MTSSSYRLVCWTIHAELELLVSSYSASPVFRHTAPYHVKTAKRDLCPFAVNVSSKKEKILWANFAFCFHIRFHILTLKSNLYSKNSSVSRIEECGTWYYTCYYHGNPIVLHKKVAVLYPHKISFAAYLTADYLTLQFSLYDVDYLYPLA